jgi:nitroreductase
VRDRQKLRVLADWYLELWDAYLAEVSDGDRQVGAAPSSLEAADRFARALADLPALVVVGAKLSALYATDQGLGRLSVVGGASIYPAVQSFCLACRALGLGTALTTLLCQREPDVKDLLGIPSGIATVGHIAVGRPAGPWPAKLKRRPVAEIAFGDVYGQPLPGLKPETSTDDRPLD